MTTTTIEAAPVVHLSNGLRVVNFSSPHPFNFVDGSELAACSKDRSKALELGRKGDIERPWQNALHAVKGEVLAVTPVFSITPAVEAELDALQECWDVDIILVPFPVLQLLREQSIGQDWPHAMDRFSKVGTVIMADRITKAAAIDKFGR
jgi:hypothetical protein